MLRDYDSVFKICFECSEENVIQQPGPFHVKKGWVKSKDFQPSWGWRAIEGEQLLLMDEFERSRNGRQSHRDFERRRYW
jgi:hypothetical protein